MVIPFVPDEPMWPEDAELLHIIAQFIWHGDAYIAGNLVGLTRLRDAIDAALASPRTTQIAEVMCNDGEGYHVRVRCETEREMALMPLGYTDEIAGGKDGGLGWPHWMTAPDKP